MLEYAKQKWNEISKVKDFLAFVEDPKVDVMEFFKTQADTSKSGFWIAGNINFDIDIGRILKQKPQIKNDEISYLTRTPSEIEHHKKFKFTNGYDRHVPNDEVMQIVSALGFNERPSVYINNQTPGTLIHRHIDFVSCYTYDRSDDKNFLELPYDKERRQATGHKDIWRCFVALDDWKPGQLVNFEPGFWSNWKKGDIMFWDWRNTPHSTANCGINDRPLLKITGTIVNDQWVREAKHTGTIKQFNV